MASVVAYLYPTSGTFVPAASGTFAIVNATLTWLDADTVATLTHNFGLSTAEVAQGFPLVMIDNDSTSTATAFGATLVSGLANTVVLSKASAAGSGGVLAVKILKPNTSIR